MNFFKISKYISINNFIYFFNNSKTESYNLLGRWCHKGIPNCDESVINKKINFALMDNNLCTKIKKIYKTSNNKKIIETK